MKAVAVEKVGMKFAKETAGMRKAGNHAEGRLANIQMDDAVRGGPLVGKRGKKNEKSHGMAALRHAIGEGQGLSFRTADAERREHIDDPHSTRIHKEV
jgi:hypothetical protein